MGNENNKVDTENMAGGEVVKDNDIELVLDNSMNRKANRRARSSWCWTATRYRMSCRIWTSSLRKARN